MTFRTAYQLCVQVQESSLRFNMHFFVKENSAPRFDDLVKAIQQSAKDLSVNEYQIRLDTRDPESNVLCDDQSLRNALQTLDNNDNLLNIMLSRKSRHISEPYKISNLQQQHPFRLTSILDDNVPVVKPTVYRWKSSHNNTNNDNNNNDDDNDPDPYRRRSAPAQPTLPLIDKHGSVDTSTGIRKDSGVSLEADEPVKKKKRVLSAEESMQSRKLPELQHHAEPFFYDSRRRPTVLEPRSPRIHPLDRRTSCASTSASTSTTTTSTTSAFMPPIGTPSNTSSSSSSSASSSSSKSTGITLPAITSITAGHHQHHPHPSHHHHQRRATAAHLFDLTSNATRVMSSSALMHSATEQQQQRHHRASAPMALQPHHDRHIQQQQQQQQQQLFVCEKMIEAGRTCGQTFRRSYDLSRHQTIHLKNRPYCYCDQCGKKFTRMDALRRHERVQGHAPSSSSSSSSTPGAGRIKYRNNRTAAATTATTTTTTAPSVSPPSTSSNNNAHRLHRHAQQARA